MRMETELKGSSSSTATLSVSPRHAKSGGWNATRIESLVWFIVQIIYFATMIVMGKWACDEYNEGIKTTPGMQWGWIPGRAIDLSDGQWRAFRKFIPLLLTGLIVFNLLRRALSFLCREREGSLSVVRVGYYLATSTGFLLYLHGNKSVYCVAIAVTSFLIGRVFGGSRLNPICTWLFACMVLVLSDYYKGFIPRSFAQTTYGLLSFLDAYVGEGNYAWHVQFNLTLCRLISFNLDYYWALNRKPPHPKLHTKDDLTIRTESHSPLACYSLVNFLVYVYYIPLYVAGPILPFNAFISQLHRPQTQYSVGKLIRMLFACLGYMVVIEVMLHYEYYYSINEYRTWLAYDLPPWQVAWAGYFTLNFMFIKFLTIWRFFRVWALFDGVDTVENMNRCVNNNYTFQGFWRQWHASLNHWIVRYMYVPLGGSRTQMWSMWIIFTFIGLWHDLWWRWLAWAWLNCVFFSAERLIMTYFCSEKFTWLHERPWYRRFVAACGAVNIMLLMVANLAILHGFEGSALFLRQAFVVSGGPQLWLVAWFYLFASTMVMQEIRDMEQRSQEGKRF